MALVDDLIDSYSGSNPSGTPVTGDQVAALPASNRAVLADNAIGGYLQTASGFTGGMSHIMYGIQAKQAADYQAAQLRFNAQEAQGAAHREAAARLR